MSNADAQPLRKTGSASFSRGLLDAVASKRVLLLRVTGGLIVCQATAMLLIWLVADSRKVSTSQTCPDESWLFVENSQRCFKQMGGAGSSTHAECALTVCHAVGASLARCVGDSDANKALAGGLSGHAWLGQYGASSWASGPSNCSGSDFTNFNAQGDLDDLGRCAVDGFGTHPTSTGHHSCTWMSAENGFWYTGSCLSPLSCLCEYGENTTAEYRASVPLREARRCLMVVVFVCVLFCFFVKKMLWEFYF